MAACEQYGSKLYAERVSIDGSEASVTESTWQLKTWTHIFRTERLVSPKPKRKATDVWR